jgi:hypothetical protein
MKPFTFLLVLVLATCQMPLRDSEARPWDALHCGRTDLAHLPAKYFLGETCSAPCDGEEHFFDLKKDPNLARPLPKSAVRTDLVTTGQRSTKPSKRQGSRSPSTLSARSQTPGPSLRHRA